MTLGGGVLNCWAKQQKSVALSSWESELFAAITSGTRSLGIHSKLMDLGHSCSVAVATDSQSVIDHSRRRGHSVCIKTCWSEVTLVARSSTAANLADVCTKALSGNRIRELFGVLQ